VQLELSHVIAVCALLITCIGTLAGAVVALWRIYDRRQVADRKDLSRRLDEQEARIKALEDDRDKRAQKHAKDLEGLSGRYDATTQETTRALHDVAHMLKDLAQAQNKSNAVLAKIPCTYQQDGEVPAPHTWADCPTAIMRKEKGQAHG